MKALFIQNYQGSLSVSQLCKVLKISKSGYYEAVNRPVCARVKKDEELLVWIRTFFYRSRKSYGCKRIARDFKDHNMTCSKNRVIRLMKQGGLKSTHTKKFRVMTTDSKHSMPVAENVLNRKFKAVKPNEKWVGDITYIPTAQGFVYLAVMLDLFSRKIVGFAIEEHMRTELCASAFKKAITLRSVDAENKLVHHTDRDSQYASDDYQHQLDNVNVISSMSRKGNCWDNGVAESFFKTLKTECVYQNKYKNLNHAKEDITDYIYNFYNNNRKHSTLDYMSPVDYEMKYNQNMAA